jgi:large subunit ribosomal protein L16
MGSGKGNPEYFVAVVKSGTIMFEIGGVDAAVAKEALRKAGNKLNVLCKVVKKGDLPENV